MNCNRSAEISRKSYELTSEIPYDVNLAINKEASASWVAVARTVSIQEPPPRCMRAEGIVGEPLCGEFGQRHPAMRRNPLGLAT
jgi:hypothetical protein